MIVKFYSEGKLIFISKSYEATTEQATVRKAIKAFSKHCKNNYIDFKPDTAVFVEDGIERRVTCLYEYDTVTVDGKEIVVDPRLIINWHTYPFDTFVEEEIE